MPEEWIPTLKETLTKRALNGGFRRGELSKLFVTVAEKHKEPNIEKLKNYYYRVLKKEIENETNQLTLEKKQTNSKTSTNEYFEVSSLDQVVFNKLYPANDSDIASYKDINNTDNEWLKFSDLDKNIVGNSFEQYISSLNKGNMIQKKVCKQNIIEVIEKENVIKSLTLFSGFTRHKNASRQAEELSHLLLANETNLNELRIQKYFDSLKFGDKVEVKIAKLMSYGAMVNLVKYPTISGMIHISEITNKYVEDISLYLNEGDVLFAEILQKKDDIKSKLTLSIKYLSIPPKNKMINSEKSISAEPKESPVLEKTLKKTDENKTDVKIEPHIHFPDEWNDVLEYVKSFVGPLSPEAKSKLIELIQEYGLFKFSLGINNTTKEFKSDLGLILLEKAETKLRDGL